MAINLQWISLTHEQLHLLLIGARSLFHKINVLGHFEVILQASNFCKVKFADISSAGMTANKIIKIL